MRGCRLAPGADKTPNVQRPTCNAQRATCGVGRRPLDDDDDDDNSSLRRPQSDRPRITLRISTAAYGRYISFVWQMPQFQLLISCTDSSAHISRPFGRLPAISHRRTFVWIAADRAEPGGFMQCDCWNGMIPARSG